MAKGKKIKRFNVRGGENQAAKSSQSLNKPSTECLFCKIAKGEIPSAKIYEDENVFAFLDISPVAIGHALIVPKKHSITILDADDSTLNSIAKAIQNISRALMKALGADGINTVINTGRAAGQLIPHTHAHLIPRFRNDGQHLFNWKMGKYKEGMATQIAEKIKKAL